MGAGENRTALSVDGQQVSGFMLSYNCALGKWRFRIPSSDQASPSFVDAWAQNQQPAGKWLHLVGAWDEAEGRANLWVNGVLDPSASLLVPTEWKSARGAGWTATGPVVVGRDRWAGQAGGGYSGQVREVRLWNRVVTGDDLWGTNQDESAGTQATQGILAPTEVASWDFNGGLSSACGDATSVGYWAQPLMLHGCADPYVPEQSAGYTGDAHDDNDALWLNHAQPDGYGTHGDGAGYAATTQPIVRTDQSFTVTAWVRLGDLNTDQMVAAQVGNRLGRFMLYYNQPDGRWRLFMYSQDDDNFVGDGLSGSPAVAGRWTHLAAVYDAGRSSMSLYVDGVLTGSIAYTAPGFHATGPLQIGRTLFYGNQAVAPFRGEIDQVKLFAGVLSAREIAALHRR
jgi:hypothetical protein